MLLWLSVSRTQNLIRYKREGSTATATVSLQTHGCNRARPGLFEDESESAFRNQTRLPPSGFGRRLQCFEGRFVLTVMGSQSQCGEKLEELGIPDSIVLRELLYFFLRFVVEPCEIDHFDPGSVSIPGAKRFDDELLLLFFRTVQRSARWIAELVIKDRLVRVQIGQYGEIRVNRRRILDVVVFQ